MTTSIPTTHQQDRVAQQKLVNARQLASTQGQPQGQAFAQMLSLACDEDTDLDARQMMDSLNGDGVAKDTTQRSTRDKRAADMTDPAQDATEPSDSTGLHPTAQANAILLALLGQAQAAPATPDTDTPAEPTGVSTPPGRSVRTLAQQLGPASPQSAFSTDNGQAASSSGGQLSETSASAAGWPATANAQLSESGTHAGTGGDAGGASFNHGLAERLAVDARKDAAETDASDDSLMVSVETNRAEIKPSSGDSQTAAGMGSDASAAGDVGDAKAPQTEKPSAADQWRDQWAEAMDQMAQQVSYWVGQGGVRQATLRVDHGWQKAMDVKLSLKDGKANVEFRTDHEAARAAIEQGGTDVLRGLLAGSGIDLGQVSIGSQGGGSGQGQTDGHEARGRGSERTESHDALATETVIQPRRSQSVGLDLYI